MPELKADSGMQRKVMQHGPATLVVCLPSNWVRRNNIEKGDVMYLEDKGFDLVLRKNHVKAIKSEWPLFYVGNIARQNVEFENKDKLLKEIENFLEKIPEDKIVATFSLQVGWGSG